MPAVRLMLFSSRAGYWGKIPAVLNRSSKISSNSEDMAGPEEEDQEWKWPYGIWQARLTEFQFINYWVVNTATRSGCMPIPRHQIIRKLLRKGSKKGWRKVLPTV